MDNPSSKVSILQVSVGTHTPPLKTFTVKGISIDDPTSIEVRGDDPEDVKVKLYGISMPDRLQEE